MVSMDIFENDAFKATQMSASVDKIGYTPNFLSGFPRLYIPRPVRTTTVWVEERDTAPALIMTSERGTAPKEKGADKRKARAFKTDRIALGATIEASEVQDIRAFGMEAELKEVMAEVSRRQFLIRQDVDLTKEFHLKGLIQGQFIDADGSVIYDWADEFGQTQMADVTFAFNASTAGSFAIRKACNQLRRGMLKNLRGLGGANVEIHAICASDFYDALTGAKEVLGTYLNWSAAQELQNKHGEAYGAFRYGGIWWHDYRGTDDNTVGTADASPAAGTLGIASGTCRFVPVGAGIFQMAYSPAERMEFVNTTGQELYSWMVTDKDRNMWVRPELASYPLPVCTMPQALCKGIAG